MDSMKCWDCTLKHLAAAVSYAKEVMSGHTKGNELDHRIDLLGELVNAEHHAECLDKEVFDKISELRKYLQGNRVDVNSKIIDNLRGLYIRTEDAQLKEEGVAAEEIKKVDAEIAAAKPAKSIIFPPQLDKKYESPLDVVYMEVTNPEYFRYSYDSLKRYLKSYGNIYALKSSLDLTEYGDVKVVDKSLLEFCKFDELSDNFLVVREDEAWINEDDALYAYPHFAVYTNERSKKAMNENVKLGLEFDGRVFDYVKPNPVNKVRFVQLMNGYGETEFPLTQYYYLLKTEVRAQISFNAVVLLDRPVCCSNRGKLQTYRWVTWTNKVNFDSMLEYLKKISKDINSTVGKKVTVITPEPEAIDPNTGETMLEKTTKLEKAINGSSADKKTQTSSESSDTSKK